MGEYAYAVICVALVCKTVSALSPDGEEGPLGKYIVFIGALVTCTVMLLPIAQVIRSSSIDIKDNLENTQQHDDTYLQGEYYAQQAKDIICQLYGIDGNAFRARAVAVCGDGGDIKKLVLTVPEKYVVDTEEAQKILKKIFGFEVMIEKE